MVSELTRILDLPIIDQVPDFTESVRVPGGEWSLRPAQSRALYMMQEYGGLLGSIAVGAGKTLIGQLAPTVLGVDPKKVLVLTTAQLVREAKREYEIYQQHFDVCLPRYLSYSKLSSQSGVDLLSEYDPTWIIADEAHNLKNRDAARTKRFMKFMRKNPHVKFAAMSGTLTTRSLHDFAHLSEMALRDLSPLPRTYPRLRMWARCLDVRPRETPTPADWRQVYEIAEWAGGDRTPRDAFRYRLATAPGCVLTESSSCDKDLIYESFITQMPDEIFVAMKKAKSLWVLPNGIDIADPLRLRSKLRELGQGFYYEWVWPDGIVDTQWLTRRAAYNAAVREYIRRYQGEDTYGLVTQALQRDPSTKPAFLVEAYRKWEHVMHRPEPPVRPVWLSDHIFAYVQKHKQPGRIFWYEHRAVGARLKEILPTAMAGEPVPPDDCVALSISSHGTGFNLQRFHSNVVLCPPASGAMWEQMLGRTHRAGQTRSVNIFVNRSIDSYRDAWRSALEQAKYIEETTGASQKLKQLRSPRQPVISKFLNKDLTKPA